MMSNILLHTRRLM
jgi:ribosomal protein L35